MDIKKEVFDADLAKVNGNNVTAIQKCATLAIGQAVYYGNADWATQLIRKVESIGGHQLGKLQGYMSENAPIEKMHTKKRGTFYIMRDASDYEELPDFYSVEKADGSTFAECDDEAKISVADYIGSLGNWTAYKKPTEKKVIDALCEAEKLLDRMKKKAELNKEFCEVLALTIAQYHARGFQ